MINKKTTYHAKNDADPVDKKKFSSSRASTRSSTSDRSYKKDINTSYKKDKQDTDSRGGSSLNKKPFRERSKINHGEDTKSFPKPYNRRKDPTQIKEGDSPHKKTYTDRRNVYRPSHIAKDRSIDKGAVLDSKDIQRQGPHPKNYLPISRQIILGRMLAGYCMRLWRQKNFHHIDEERMVQNLNAKIEEETGFVPLHIYIDGFENFKFGGQNWSLNIILSNDQWMVISAITHTVYCGSVSQIQMDRTVLRFGHLRSNHILKISQDTPLNSISITMSILEYIMGVYASIEFYGSLPDNSIAKELIHNHIPKPMEEGLIDGNIVYILPKVNV